MTAILPQGLISATITVEQHYSFDDSDINPTNSGVLHKLWKVFALQSDLTQDNAATRSRNLFWRVWSSPILTQSMTSARLMRLWQQCNQDISLTPIADHLTLPHGSISQHFPGPGQSRKRSSSLSPTTGTHPPLEPSREAGQSIGPALQDFRFPSGPGETRGERRPPSPGHSTESSRPPHPDESSGSASQTTSDSSSKPAMNRTTSGGRQRLPVLAAAGKSRTRPQLPRRKSSSQRSPVAPNAPKSPKGHSDAARAGSTTRELGPAIGRPTPRGPSPGLPLLPSTTSGIVFALPPASSWQSVDSASENLPLATTAPANPSSDLVDRGFRGKFVETQKKLGSSTNLAALGRMKKTGSVVRFADEIPQELRKGKEKEILPPPGDENAGPSRLRTSMTSEAISDDDDDEDKDNDSSDDDTGLPRTKSQLSLMIKNKRDETGSSDLGPETQAHEMKGKEKEKQKAKSKEEELLSMGRRDGVTKAGGVQVPKQQRVSGHDDPGYISSSSPEPLF